MPRDPNPARALDILASVVGNDGRVDEAITLNRKLLTIDSGNIRAMNDLAWMLSEEKGQYEEALALAAKAYAQNPNDPRLLDTYGVVCFRLKRLDEAQKYLREAVRLMPTSGGEAAKSRYHLAQVDEAMGQDRRGSGSLPSGA